MKKFLCFITVIVMIICLCACNTGNSTVTPEETSSITEAPISTPETVEVTSAPIEETNTVTKIGLICLHDENSTYDANFIQAFNAVCEEYGLEGEIKSNVGESEACYDAACELADDGCQIVFGDSFGFEDYMIKAAEEYTDVEFCHATGDKAHTENLDNYHNGFASIYEGRYLAGVAAGLKIQEMIDAGTVSADNVMIGYVGAKPYAEVISGYTSWYLGVKSVIPQVTMEVMFTNSWYDETAEKEAAQAMINDGCVLISQHADSMGAPTACEEAGIPNVSYNGSTEVACPTTFIVSSRIDWAPYFEYCINCVNNSEEIAKDWVGTIETGSVKLTDFGGAAASGTDEKVSEIMMALMNGDISVFDTANFTVNGEILTSYMADIDFDDNYTPDTEVIINGVFNESTYRSAPYFDINIDGITIK